MTEPVRPMVSDDTLHAYVDGLLDPEGRAEVERHLAAHPEARARVQAWHADSEALRRALMPVAAEPMPDRLSPQRLAATPRQRDVPRRAVAAAVVAAFLLGAGVGWFDGRAPMEPHGLAALTAQATLAQRVFDAPGFSPSTPVGDAALPVGVDRGRAGQMVRAPDLSAAGYKLLSTHVVPTAQGSAALFVYGNGAGDTLAVMARLMIGIDTNAPLRRVVAEGSHGYAWSRDGLGFSLVSDGGVDLRPIAEAARDRTIGGPENGEKIPSERE